MIRRLVCCLLIFAGVALLPFRSPAPLVFTPGQGWTYEPVGGEGKWMRTRAKDQLDVAQAAFDKKDFNLALKAARRVVKIWPLSDHAPSAQYLVARCYEAKHVDQRAFDEYQVILEKYPKSESIKEVLNRQYEIANRFLAGERFKIWGVIPAYRSMDKTADMYAKIVKNGLYSEVAPQAQLRIGAARQKGHDLPAAVKAYEEAADRYHDRPEIAADATYHIGDAQRRQAQTAEYDQSMAGQAIASYTDFLTLFPQDARAGEARNAITAMTDEQARGSLQIARFYEKRKRMEAARIYYNEVVNHLLSEPNSPYAQEARQRIDAIKKQMQPAAK